MKVEFFKHNINKQDIANVNKVLNSLFLTTGDTVKEFENKFALYLGIKNVIGVTSCTAALHLCLLAWGIGEGDEVITTPMSFCATSNAILQSGAFPMFVDVEKDTGLIDVELIEDAITSKTKAIMPVHLYGQMCDMRRIRQIANKYNLVVIEDAAHCIEGYRDNTKVGHLGDAACFSFYATKSITCGEGGAIVTDDTEKAGLIKTLRNHGTNKLDIGYNMPILGYKYNMNNIQAAFALSGHLELVGKQRFVHDYIHNLFDIDPESIFLQWQKTNNQVIAVRHANTLSVLPRTLLYLKRIRKDYKLFQFPILAVYENISLDEIQQRSYAKNKKKIFFSSTRHIWGEDRKYGTDKKGNDISFRAIALYKEKTGDTNFEIHLIEKGYDVNRTKELLIKLGLADYTKWIEQMKREELFNYYKTSTLCFGQFATQALEFNAIEPMSCGIPTISWCGAMDEFPYTEVPFYSSLPPVFNSQNPEEIASYMAILLDDEDKYNTVSHNSYIWCQNNCSVEYGIKYFLELIDGKNIYSRQILLETS